MDSWIFCIVLFTATFTVCRGASFIEAPGPVTSEVGKDVNITCRVSLKKDELEAVRWSRIVDAGKPEGEMIYTWHLHAEPLKSNKYEVTIDGGNFVLRILNLDFYDGGLYHCMLVLAAKTVQADLVVLNTPIPITPSTTVQSGSVAELSCEAQFAAPREEEIGDQHMPVLQTFLGSTKLKVEEEVFPGLPGTKWWVVKQTAEVTVTDDDNGKELICSIETPNPYYHLEARKNLWVQHPVSMVTVQSQMEVYYVGDVINCTANGNPEPDYEWHPINVPQMTGARIYNSPQLEVTKNLIGTNTWKCVVSNNVGGKVMKEIEVTFEVQPDPYAAQTGASQGGGSSTVAIALGVVIPIVVIGAVLLIGFLVYRHKTNKESSDPEKTPDVPKELPPNPKPPGHMKIMPPQVYDPEEGKKNAAGTGTPLLEEELRPARPIRPTPQPRNQNPEKQPMNEDGDSSMTDV